MNIEPAIRPEHRPDARGTSQLGLRLYHDRLVLSLIRRHGALSKVELARQTGLTAQTVSVIVRELEKNGLVVPGEPQRGKVGQPMVPFRLEPDGAFALGLKLGRRSGEVMLMDLAGKVRGQVRQSYEFPSPGKFLNFALKSIDRLLRGLAPDQRQRITGLGIAAPFELWNWGRELGAPLEVMEAWRGFDLTAELANHLTFPVIPCNDATAACAAELLFGEGQHSRDFAYFYVGHFIGGGLVLNGALVQGRTGNAAALGSMLVPTPAGAAGQLIHAASFYTLEKDIAALGRDPAFMWDQADDWSSMGAALERWLAQAASGIAHAAISVAAITECAEVVIDGAMPEGVRARLVEATRSTLATLNQSGLSAFNVSQGGIGRDARAIGAASLPLFANFIIDRNVLFKERV